MEKNMNSYSSVSETMYDKLLKYSDELVFILDKNGIVINANDRAIYLFDPTVVGLKIDTIFKGIDASMSSIINTEIVQSFHAHATPARMNRHSFKVTFVPVIRSGVVNEIMVIGRDLSEIESYQEEVERLRKRVHVLEEKRRLASFARNNKEESASLALAMRKLQRANQKLEEINNNLTKELELAARLQKSLVPHRVPEHRYLQFAFHYEPMELVGGDYYDVIDLGDQKTGVIVADVSGHGVSSAFIAAMLKVSFLNYSLKYLSPSAVLKKLNKEYCNVIQTGDYVTAFYAVFDPPRKRMTYSGAGHPNPLLLHGKSGKIEHLSSDGFFIGMFEKAEYNDRTIGFQAGDRYMVFTDGIIEAYSDEKSEQFGANRLLESFRKNREKPVDRMIKSIITDVKKFMEKSKFYDDYAMVAVEYKAHWRGSADETEHY